MTLGDADGIAGPDNDRARVSQIHKLLLNLVCALEEHLTGVRAVRVPTGRSYGLLQGQTGGHRILTRPVDLTKDVERPKRDDLYAHPRIVDVAIGQFGREVVLQLLNRPVACRKIANQWKRKVAAAGDHVVAGQGVFPEHDDVQLVARRNAVLIFGLNA